MYPGSSKQNKKSISQLISEMKTKPETEVVQEEEKLLKKLSLKDFKGKSSALPADMKVSEAHKLLSEHPAFRDIPALKVGKQAWKHNYPQINISRDNRCVAFLYSYYTKTKSQVAEKQLEKYVNLYQNYISTNGLLKGVVTRMIDSIPRVEPIIKVHQSSLDYVGQHFVLKFENKIPSKIDFDDEKIFKITATSDAGLPYMMLDEKAKTKDHIVEAIEKAKQLITILNQDDLRLTNFVSYMRAHPDEFTFMLKRKQERMEFSKIGKKVRPYYVPPLHLKLLFTWVSYYIQEALVNYEEHETSNSAYKASWFYGGTTNFIELVVNKTIKEAVEAKYFVFRAVCFGDDNYWVFAFPDGSFFIMAPDASAMDMNNSSVFGQILMKLVSTYHTDQFEVGPPKLYMQLLYLLVTLAYKTPVQMFGAYRMQILWAKRAGINLTSILDILCSNYCQGLAEAIAVQCFGDMLSVKDITFKQRMDKFLDILIKRTKDEVKITYKSETLTPIVYNDFPSCTVFFLPFLGYYFKKETIHILTKDGKSKTIEGWVPIPKDMDERFISYVLPQRRCKDDNAALENILERIYGITLSGIWLNDIYYDIVKEHYDLLYKSGTRPQVVDAFPGNCFDDIEELMEHFPELPEQHVIKAMYLLNKMDFLAFMHGDISAEPRIKPEIQSDISAIDSLDLRGIEEASTMFGSIKIASKHAGKASLPAERSLTLPPKTSTFSQQLASSKPVKAGIKKGGKLQNALDQFLTHFEEPEEEEQYEEYEEQYDDESDNESTVSFHSDL